MTILYVNNEFCNSFTQLKDYFDQRLSSQVELFMDLVNTGRDQIISAWLREHGKTELAIKLENIDTNLGDTQYFAKMKAIILEREDIKVPSKTEFSQCFTIESIDREEEVQGARIRVKLKVQLSVNEFYELKVQTSWGVRALYINPFKVNEGNYITETFNFRKYPGKPFADIYMFVDNKQLDVNIVEEKSIPATSDDDFVDLGLSVKWAKCNLGATSPEGYGDYYAWGETRPKDGYSEENSKTYGKIMSCIAGNPQYDAATASLGQGVRLPTKEEIQELVDNCTTEWTTRDGVNGRLVTSNINGSSIFLPAAGYRFGTSLYHVGEYGDYWSSTPNEDDDNSAYNLGFSGGNFGWFNYWFRGNGHSVRPVREI